MRHLRFTLQPGEHVALVGRERRGQDHAHEAHRPLYDPTEGRVLLDGVGLREYDFRRFDGRSAGSSRTSFGEVIEQGTHEGLVSGGGLYDELFELQAAGYR